jgi:hypothetical protein
LAKPAKGGAPSSFWLCLAKTLKHSLHPILKKLELEQGGFNIFRRFRITELETGVVPATLQHTWSGHAKSHVSEVYKKLLKQREWRLRWAEKAGTGFTLPSHQKAAGGGSKWQVWQDFGIPQSRLSLLKSGGREGIRTPGLLVANGESLKLRRVATIS